MNSIKWPSSAEAYLHQIVIGKGATATVVQSRLKEGDTVAIKKIASAADTMLHSRVDSEIKVWKSLKHPHIVRYFTSFQVNEEMWIVSEFMDVGSIRDVMRYRYPKGFPEQLVRPILLQTLLGLQFIHASGHIHRDIKAGNLLMNGAGEVKLADFGVSARLKKENGKEKVPKTFAGTPCWMAPEVMEQEDSGYTIKADIWSFGITAIELMQGEPPYARLHPVKVVVAVMNNAPPVIAKEIKASKRLMKLLTKCLLKPADKRVSAEKLAKNRYFRKTPGPDYLRENLINGLPSLAERYLELTMRHKEKIRKLK